MEISNLPDAEFKTLVIRMLKEFSEDFNSIKKIQPETKDTLMEIKNNLQENNSRVDEADNQINDLEHNEAKTSQSEQEERRIKKNEEIFPATLGQLQAIQQSHHRGAGSSSHRGAINGKSV